MWRWRMISIWTIVYFGVWLITIASCLHLFLNPVYYRGLQKVVQIMWCYQDYTHLTSSGKTNNCLMLGNLPIRVMRGLTLQPNQLFLCWIQVRNFQHVNFFVVSSYFLDVWQDVWNCCEWGYSIYLTIDSITLSNSISHRDSYIVWVGFLSTRSENYTLMEYPGWLWSAVNQLGPPSVGRVQISTAGQFVPIIVMATEPAILICWPAVTGGPVILCRRWSDQKARHTCQPALHSAHGHIPRLLPAVWHAAMLS